MPVRRPDRMSRDTKIRRALLLILTGAFALRLIVFLLALRDPSRFYSPDGREYWALGQHFGAAFGNTHSAYFDLGLKRTPGYPAMLAVITSLTGDRESVVVFVQVLMGVATVALLYLLVRELCGVRAASDRGRTSRGRPDLGDHAELPAARDAVHAAARRQERCCSCVPYGPAVGSCWSPPALIFGASALVRPVALYIWIVLSRSCGCSVQRQPWRRRLINSGIVMLAFLVPVGGWIVRNERTTGVAVLSTIEGRDLLRFRASHALAFDRGISIDEGSPPADRQGRSRDEGRQRGGVQPSRDLRGDPDHAGSPDRHRGQQRARVRAPADRPGPRRTVPRRRLEAPEPSSAAFGRWCSRSKPLLLLVLLVGAACGTVLSIVRREVARPRGRRRVRGLPRRDREQRCCVFEVSRAGVAVPRVARRLRRRVARRERQTSSNDVGATRDERARDPDHDVERRRTNMRSWSRGLRIRGGETSVVRMHSGNGPHEEMDRRAIACFDQALVDPDLAGDERLRQVLPLAVVRVRSSEVRFRLGLRTSGRQRSFERIAPGSRRGCRPRRQGAATHLSCSRLSTVGWAP